MAEGSEKRFREVMDKLYCFPRRNPKPTPRAPSSSGGGASSVKEGSLQIQTRSVLSSMGSSAWPDPKPCRPWDRGDLSRRLATFKAMTWFGKPKVIGPLNCARRGWVNVEMDTLSCEACGSRLLFSTPSSSAFQQVEKAAAVFSLKLDNGHKTLCPWKDNICDESLALFPPTPAAVLVEGYKERASALLQLSALPVISLDAMAHVRSTKLDHFLKQPSNLTCTIDKYITLADNSNSMTRTTDQEAAPATEYFQAQKLISLCGWEVRVLPYFVDCEALGQSTERPKSNSFGHVISEKYRDNVIYSSVTRPVEAQGDHNNPQSVESQSDPTSAVLDCKSCGACVGLWTFKSVSRPLEVFSLSDLPDTNNENDSVDSSNKSLRLPKTDNLGNPSLSSNERDKSFNLKLTIAGGLPPTKQCFRPRVSLPIISRHLRAELCGSKHSPSFSSEGHHASHQSKSDDILQHQNVNTDLAVTSGGVSETLKRKRNEDEGSSLDGGGLTTYQSSGTARMDDVPNAKETDAPTKSGLQDPKERVTEENLVFTNKNCKETLDRRGNNSDENYNLSQDIGNAGLVANPNPTIDDKQDEVTGIEKDGLSGDDTSCQNISSKGDSRYPSDVVSPCPANVAHDLDSGESMTSEKNEGNLKSQTSADTDMGGSNVYKSKKTTSSPVKDKSIVAFGEDLVSMQWKSIKEFDPIRQHRPFCPWISPEGGGGRPGWKLTLAALVPEEDSSLPSVKNLPSRPLDETDDPVVSVRNLFTTPPSKKLKTSG